MKINVRVLGGVVLAGVVIYLCLSVRPWHSTINRLGGRPEGVLTKLEKANITYRMEITATATTTHPEDKYSMTIVTAFFNLGNFQKGGGGKYTTQGYHQWAGTFKYLINPLVVYTDSKDFFDVMSKLRQNLADRTRIMLVQRKDFWSFEVIDRIRKIYATPGYPKHHPNTVLPEYSCAMHSKFAVVEDAIKKGYFPSRYTAWLDIGCFREISGKNEYFKLIPPENLDDGKIAYGEVYPKQNVGVDSIIKNNMVWVGGSMFSGRTPTVVRFTQQYKRTMMCLLDLHLMNTDQQVLYAMFNPQIKPTVKPEVELQIYHRKGNYNVWFLLGYRFYRNVNNTNIQQVLWN